jgi:hypothetical protein
MQVASILAIVLVVASFILHIETVKATVNPAIHRQHFLPLVAAFNVLVAFAMWSSKVPVLLVYIRLFGMPIGRLRVVCYATMVSTFCAFLAGGAVVGAACTPITPAVVKTCTVKANAAGFSLGFVALATDVIVVAIPIPVLAGLKLPRHEKVGLFVVFLAGILAIVAGVASSYFKWLSTIDQTPGSMRVAMGCRYVPRYPCGLDRYRMQADLPDADRIIESCIAIIAGCVPAAQAFWNIFVVRARQKRRDALIEV